MPLTDANLIDRILQDDDRNAFNELVRRHQSAVRGLHRRLTNGNETLADDLAQITFIRAYRSLGKFRRKSKFGTWLYRIAYNVFLSEIRRASSHKETELVEEIQESAQPSHSRKVSLKQDLEEGMKRLTEPERAAIFLCYNEGFSHEDAAKSLNMPLGTIKTHILRGKTKLRHFLKDWAPGS